MGKGRNVLQPCQQPPGDAGAAYGPAPLLPAPGMLSTADRQWVLIDLSAVLFLFLNGRHNPEFLLKLKRNKYNSISPFQIKTEKAIHSLHAHSYPFRRQTFSFLGTNRGFALQPSSQAAFLIKVVTYLKKESRKYLDLSSFCQSSPLGKEIMN